MRKEKAIELLGGTVPAAAAEVGVSYQAVNQWPEELPDRIADRVLAALARRYLPPSLLGEESTATKETLAHLEHLMAVDEAKAVGFLKTRGYSVFKGAPF